MFGSLIQLRLRLIRPIKKKLVFSVLKWLQSYKPYTCLASPILIYSTLNPVDFFLSGSSHGDQDNDLFKDGSTGSDWSLGVLFSSIDVSSCSLGASKNSSSSSLGSTLT